MTGHARELSHENQKFSSRPVFTSQRDITTPITTVPTIILSNPTASTPFINPTSTSDTYSPAMESPKRSSPPSSGASWCIASQSASQKALQIALDYACGYGGTDCSAIQAGQRCYNPNTIHDHASYAFNSYYQKNPVPNSCNFGGTAVITSTDPSTMACQYTSTSTSSSVLNTTNSKGSTVFGAVPSSPSPSAATCQEIKSSDSGTDISGTWFSASLKSKANLVKSKVKTFQCCVGSRAHAHVLLFIGEKK
ncbi:glucan endo-1,3-beta-glucosidase 3-like [Cucumis melo var. makuwa]|uniref:Glucan endo-1,3-beta-glucosidase 3-like n=1 Tax=Cucumis melo var. makuwa TaxID=1194695 RepID=A0A5A7SSE1_CUCMM|nr:glucan endo-1,3-beta-glucosidase 3-like [Cucumis melo var. makuwa]TYK17762.1 glucan endo-1,3-beta-glucosidase 3-like [Cucumis melo var. makuwa]